MVSEGKIKTVNCAILLVNDDRMCYGDLVGCVRCAKRSKIISEDSSVIGVIQPSVVCATARGEHERRAQPHKRVLIFTDEQSCSLQAAAPLSSDGLQSHQNGYLSQHPDMTVGQVRQTQTSP